MVKLVERNSFHVQSTIPQFKQYEELPVTDTMDVMKAARVALAVLDSHAD